MIVHSIDIQTPNMHCAGSILRKFQSYTSMASAGVLAYRRSWGCSPSGVQRQSPWSGVRERSPLQLDILKI